MLKDLYLLFDRLSVMFIVWHSRPTIAFHKLKVASSRFVKQGETHVETKKWFQPLASALVGSDPARPYC